MELLFYFQMKKDTSTPFPTPLHELFTVLSNEFSKQEVAHLRTQGNSTVNESKNILNIVKMSISEKEFFEKT